MNVGSGPQKNKQAKAQQPQTLPDVEAMKPATVIQH